MPRLSDRIWDAAALALVIGGVAVFAAARRALTSIGEGTYVMPPGVSAVAQADLHVAHSRLGIFIVCLGVVTGILAAARHRWRAA